MENYSLTEIERYAISKVKEKRIQLKMSQAQLADLMNVSEGFIANIESPHFRAKYNLNHLNDLARIFNCSPREFIPELHS